MAVAGMPLHFGEWNIRTHVRAKRYQLEGLECQPFVCRCGRFHGSDAWEFTNWQAPGRPTYRLVCECGRRFRVIQGDSLIVEER